MCVALQAAALLKQDTPLTLQMHQLQTDLAALLAENAEMQAVNSDLRLQVTDAATTVAEATAPADNEQTTSAAMTSVQMQAEVYERQIWKQVWNQKFMNGS